MSSGDCIFHSSRKCLLGFSLYQERLQELWIAVINAAKNPLFVLVERVRIGGGCKQVTVSCGEGRRAYEEWNKQRE